MGFKELPQFRSCLELRDGIQFLERGREPVRETPDRSRPEVLVFGLEVDVIYSPRNMLGASSFPSNECLVDDHLCRDVRPSPS